MSGKSNISNIVQNSVTKSGLDKVKKYLEIDKDSLEPNHKTENIEYGKCVVHEYVKKDGVIHIIDNKEDYVRIIEVIPTGTYDIKDKDGRISKTNGDSLTIVNGKMTIKVNGDDIEIISDSNIILKSPDGQLWKPNTLPTCPYTGTPHSIITTIKGENNA